MRSPWGSEAEEKGSGHFRREELAAVEGGSPRVRGHAMVSNEEAEFEGQLATMNELFHEFDEGAWQTEVDGIPSSTPNTLVGYPTSRRA